MDSKTSRPKSVGTTVNYLSAIELYIVKISVIIC